MKNAVIFDLDGTLWDSRESMCAIWNRLFMKYPGIETRMTLEKLTLLMGKTMEEIGDVLFPDRDKAFRLKIMDELGNEEVRYLRQNGARLYDGLRETIDLLKTEYGLYIVSNCQEGYVRAFLEAHDFGDDFDDIEESGRTGKGKGQNIRLLMERNGIKDAVYVGDTTGDEEAARQAGLPFIYASYGFGQAECPDGMIRDIRELPEVLLRVLESSKDY